MKVEFGYGGPVDGHVQELPDGIREFEVYTPVSHPGQWTGERAAATVPYETHVYRDVDLLSKAGHKLFAYSGRKRK